jgi:hypothetical protein
MRANRRAAQDLAFGHFLDEYLVAEIMNIVSEYEIDRAPIMNAEMHRESM